MTQGEKCFFFLVQYVHEGIDEMTFKRRQGDNRDHTQTACLLACPPLPHTLPRRHYLRTGGATSGKADVTTAARQPLSESHSYRGSRGAH